MKKYFLMVSMIGCISASAQLKYPETKKVQQEDDYFGTKVQDPYRWLEDDKSSETKDWVTAENKVTFDYLDKIPYRQKFRENIEKVFNYPKYSAPFRKGEWFYFYKNDGLQNQSVLYRQKGLSGQPEIVLDPNTLSKDGTTRLQLFSLNKSGKYAVIGLSKGGSDWETFYVRDMETGKNLADSINWVKVSGAAWKGDGFYYSRYPAPSGGASDLSAKNENHQVYFHMASTPQIEDIMVYQDKDNPQRFNNAGLSEDERYLFLYTSDRGKGLDGNSIQFMDLKAGDKKFRPLIKDITNDHYNVINTTDTKFLLQTDANAPNSKIIALDITDPDLSK